MEEKKENMHKASDFIEFYMGLLMIAAGIFFLLSNAIVTSGFGGISLYGVSISSGLVVIPLMVGVVALVNNPKSIVARLITICGTIFIVGSIIINIRISFRTSSAFDYIIMMLLMAGGLGYLLKAIFMARK